MKSTHFAFVALILIAAAAVTGTALFADDGIEVLSGHDEPIVNGIEVLGIEVLGSGTTYVTRIHNAPAGSYVEAEMSPNGEDMLTVDAAAIDPATGQTAVTFPIHIPGNRIKIRTPDGGVVYSLGYEGQLEYD